MAEEPTRFRVEERVVLRKFEGDVPPDCEDPEAAGFKLLEEIVLIDGQRKE